MVATLISIVGMFMIVRIQGNSGGSAQVLVYLVSIGDLLQLTFRQLINVDSFMQSSERCYQIIDLKSEAPLVLPGDEKLRPIKDLNPKKSGSLVRVENQGQTWPSGGQIEFKNVFFRYRDNTDLVLKGLDFTATPGLKCGVVGRTGAGKTSVIQALFRMNELEKGGGYIAIDGVDTSTIGLHALRDSVALLPQNPVLFSGSVRRNLDPLEVCTDEQLWQVL